MTTFGVPFYSLDQDCIVRNLGSVVPPTTMPSLHTLARVRHQGGLGFLVLTGKSNDVVFLRHDTRQTRSGRHCHESAEHNLGPPSSALPSQRLAPPIGRPDMERFFPAVTTPVS